MTIWLTDKQECVVPGAVPHHEGDGLAVIPQHVGPHLTQIHLQPVVQYRQNKIRDTNPAPFCPGYTTFSILNNYFITAA